MRTVLQQEFTALYRLTLSQRGQHVTKSAAMEQVDAFLGAVEHALGLGVQVRFHGFGTFYPMTHKGWLGRDPQTSKRLPIAEKVHARFRMGEGLDARLNNRRTL